MCAVFLSGMFGEARNRLDGFLDLGLMRILPRPCFPSRAPVGRSPPGYILAATDIVICSQAGV
jgi:hypothetical protein